LLSQLKQLFQIRAWLKSKTLNVSGILLLLSTMDLTAGTGIIQSILDFMVDHFHWMPATAVAVLTAVKAAADAILRAKSDMALKDK